MKSKIALTILLLLASQPLPGAQADDSELVCAAIYACVTDENGKPTGEVMSPYDRGACAPVYQSECLSGHASSLSENLQSCRGDVKELSDDNNSLNRKLRKLERTIRRLKSRVP